MYKLEWITRKIVDRQALVQLCNTWRGSQQKIVFTNGCFDLLHHGHLDYLAKAASLGNKLVIGVNSDSSVKRLKGAERPITQQEDRLFQLASLLCVDAVCLFDEDTPLELIQAITPKVIAKGGDYTEDTIVGATYVKEQGGSVAVIPFVTGYSTTSLIEKIRKI